MELGVTEARPGTRGHSSNCTFQLGVDKGSLPFARKGWLCLCVCALLPVLRKLTWGGELALGLRIPRPEAGAANPLPWAWCCGVQSWGGVGWPKLPQESVLLPVGLCGFGDGLTEEQE